MANNYLRYKYYLVTRDAFTALYTQIKSIVAQCNLGASVIMYLSEPTGADILLDETVRFSADVATLTPAEIKSASDGDVELHPVLLPSISTAVESRVASRGRLQGAPLLAVNAAEESQSVCDMFSEMRISLRVWYALIQQAWKVIVTSDIQMDTGVSTESDLHLQLNMKSQGDVGEAIHTNIFENTTFLSKCEGYSRESIDTISKSSILLEGKINASSAEAINVKMRSYSNLACKFIIKLASSVARQLLSQNNCITTCDTSIYNHTILQNMQRNSLSVYDNWELSQIDFTEI